FHGTPKQPLEQAFYATDFLPRFAAGLGHALADGGSAYVILSTRGDLEQALAVFVRHGWTPARVHGHAVPLEVIVIVRRTRSGPWAQPPHPRPSTPSRIATMPSSATAGWARLCAAKSGASSRRS